MFRVLFLMLLVLAALVAGPYLAGQQGYVRIETDTKIIEMSLVTLVLFFAAAMALVYGIEWLVRRFCRLSKGSYDWFLYRKQKRAQQETLEGLMQMSEGNYSKAEQQRGDDLEANKYLIEASKIGGENNIAVELARAKILVQQGKLPAARTAIDSLLELTSNNREVLRLAIRIYQDSKAYIALDKILESIGQRSFLSCEEYEALEHFVDDGLLDEVMNETGQEGLLSWWEEQPSRRRKSVYARVGLIKRLIDSEDHESAQELAFETLKKYEDEQLDGLFEQLTRLQIDEGAKLIKLLMKRMAKADVHYTDDYARVLGYIYAREGDFSRAKDYFANLLEHQECIANDRIMALYVAEQVGDTELAEKIRQINLKKVNIAEKVES